MCEVTEKGSSPLTYPFIPSCGQSKNQGFQFEKKYQVDLSE